MTYFTSERNNKTVGAPKEYNMWEDDIWKDAPRISPTKSGWIDLPKTSPIKPVWITAKKTIPESISRTLTPPKSSPKSHQTSSKSSPNLPSTPPKLSPKPQYTPPKTYPFQSTPPASPKQQWKTPEKTTETDLSQDDLNSTPRTSTPVSDESYQSPDKSKDQYECFKVHLNGSPKKMTIRGAVTHENDTIIAGHIDMKTMDPFSYTFEQYYMPNVNRCFINLLLNGPAHLMCHEHYDPNYPNQFVSNCNCLPVCNCRANIATNRNLPIGYKYNEDGFVVPTVPAMPPRGHQIDPNCIYTG